MQVAERVGDSGVPAAVDTFPTSEQPDLPYDLPALLDNAQRSLETSVGTDCSLPVSYYGSVDHHDGFSPSLPREASFRHQGWAAPRRRIYASLMRVGESCRRVQHFGECGSSLWLMKDGQEISLSCNCCHDRLCIPCQKTRQSGLVEAIMLRMHDSTAPCRFLTLTLKHSDAPLSAQLSRLTQSFRSLRQHPEISSALSGGAWFIEVKLSKDKARWHPHLHVIVEGSYVDQKLLSRCWLHVTGDSYIVDIRAIDNARHRVMYVTKYATKPLANEVTLVPSKLDEFVLAIKGKRLYQCFGRWSRAVKKTTAPKSKRTMVGRVDSLWHDAVNGDLQALVYLHQAHARWPKLRTHFPLPPELSPAGPHPPPE